VKHALRVKNCPTKLFDPEDLRRPNKKGTIRKGYRVHTVNGKRIPEHRSVMARVIGRSLTPDEHVHHINGRRLDNRPENLMILTNQEHKLLHFKVGWRIHEYSLDALLNLQEEIGSLIAKLQQR
jgi:hypothetical protein